MRHEKLALALAVLSSATGSYIYQDSKNLTLNMDIRSVKTATYKPNGITCKMTFACDINRGAHAKHLLAAISNIPDDIVC
jgi:hypothetical protein